MQSPWTSIGAAGAMALAILWGSTPEAWAQTPTEPNTSPPLAAEDTRPFRLALGLGLGSVGGISGRAGVAFVPTGSGHRFSVRLSGLAEPMVRKSPSENVRELGLLYGRHAQNGTAFASASAGVAVVGGMRRGALVSSSGCDIPPFCLLAGLLNVDEYEERSFHTLGVPLEVEAGWTFDPRFGAGGAVFANVNPERSTLAAALNVTIRFGR